MNQVNLIGNLGNDPVLNYTAAGKARCNFSIATNEKWTDKDGEKHQRTEWHRIVIWGNLAENCAKYLSKGRKVFVQGKNRTRSWDDQEGKKCFITEVEAQQVTFLTPGASVPKEEEDQQEDLPFDSGY